MMYTELKLKLMNILTHEDEDVRIQAGEILASLPSEQIVDFLSTLFKEYEGLLVRNQALQNQVQAAYLYREEKNDYAVDTTDLIGDLEW